MYIKYVYYLEKPNLKFLIKFIADFPKEVMKLNCLRNGF